MTTELAVPTSDRFGLDVFRNMATERSFLPYLILASGKATVVTNDLIPANNWGLVMAKDQVINLGKETQVWVGPWRPKAVYYGDPVLSYFTPDSLQFKEIQEKSESKDQQIKKSNAFGPEFLVWIPGQKLFATYHMSSVTARNSAQDMHGRIGKEATLKFKVIPGKEFTWLGPVILPCSIPLASYPDQDHLTAVSEKFLNPVDSTVELAPVGGEAERPR